MANGWLFEMLGTVAVRLPDSLQERGQRSNKQSKFKNLFMLSVGISSYGCTREVWRAPKMRKSSSRRSREQL